MKKLIIFLAFVLMFMNIASSTCTVTFDKTFPDPYNPSSTITATMTCSEAIEKSNAYTLTWTNETGSTLETDTGTTPSTVDTPFFDTYTIDSSYSGNITATLTGTNLEGSAVANVSGSNVNSLVITDSSFTPNAYIGELFSVVFTVTDENDKKIDNAKCIVYGTDNNSAPIQLAGESVTRNGIGSASGILDTIHTEGNQYLAVIRCSCGFENTSNVCTDEDGNSIGASSGSISYPYTISTWLNVNTVTDRSEYIMKNEIAICANITNPTRDSRIPLHIYHQVRCSSGDDNNDDTDRSLIISDNMEPDNRGISSGTTQMQCKRFHIPEPRYLQGKSSECYASTSVWVLGENNEEVLGYHTTSPVFNITSNELNINPDWSQQSSYVWNSIVNLSDDNFADFSGVGTGNIDLKLNMFTNSIKASEQYGTKAVSIHDIIATNQIENITVRNSTGTIIDHNFEILDDGSIEIEITSVDISPTGWYNVTLEFNSWEENQSLSLAEIASKTGSFAFSIDADSDAQSPGTIDFSLSALLEISDQDEIEGFFSCYIDGLKELTEIQFLKAINKTSAYTDTKTLTIPSNVNDGVYTVHCDLGVVGFGNDIGGVATDTFTILSQAPSTPFFSVDAVDEFIEDMKEDIKERIDGIVGLVKESNLLLIIGVLSLFVFIAVFLIATCFVGKNKTSQ